MIQVRFVSYQYNRWKRAVEKLRAIALSEKDNLPRRMSIDYIDEIRSNIYSGKFNGTYRSYNPRYADWKYGVYGSIGSFWFLAGDLVTSMVAKQRMSTVYTSKWFGGIPANARDTGGKSWLGKGDKGRIMSIAQYGNWMEYGRAGQPARPLFRPTLIEYSSGKALTRLGEARRRLIGGWR